MAKRGTFYLTYDKNEAKNKRQTKAIPAIAKSFRRVLIVELSRYEESTVHGPYSDASQAAHIAMDTGLEVTWMRKVIPTFRAWVEKPWRSSFNELTDPRVFLTPTMFAAAIAQVCAEALGFGEYVRPALYCEMHAGRGTELYAWKKRDMERPERLLIESACLEARRLAGSVDVYPYGSGREAWAMWPFSALADPHTNQVFGVGTYKRRRKFHDKSNPPPGLERTNVPPGLWVSPTETTGRTYWTPRLVREWVDGLGRQEYMEKYPDAKDEGDPWIYPGDYPLEVATQFAKGAA